MSIFSEITCLSDQTFHIICMRLVDKASRICAKYPGNANEVVCIYSAWRGCSVTLMASQISHKNSKLRGGRGLSAHWSGLAASLHAPLHISTDGQLSADGIFIGRPASSAHFTLKINWIYNPLSGSRLLPWAASFSSCSDVLSPHPCSVDLNELWLLTAAQDGR